VKVAHAYRDSGGDVKKGSIFDTMAYDGMGRRITQSVTGEGSANDLTTHYYYSTGNQILEERNGSDQTLKQQVWGVQYVDELVQEGINSNPSIDQTADATYTVLQDGNFNVTGIVDANGTVVERYQYDAYGARTAYVSGGSNDAGLNVSSSQNTRVVIGGVAQPYGIMDFGSQGLLHDDATGLIYNRARYRSIELDRFISQDPMRYVDGLNDYVFEGNNPTNGLDPNGTVVIFVNGIGTSEHKDRAPFIYEELKQKWEENHLAIQGFIHFQALSDLGVVIKNNKDRVTDKKIDAYAQELKEKVDQSGNNFYSINATTGTTQPATTNPAGK
jgi:RHS repeat-associated protein